MGGPNRSCGRFRWALACRSRGDGPDPCLGGADDDKDGVRMVLFVVIDLAWYCLSTSEELTNAGADCFMESIIGFIIDASVMCVD